jgi:protein TonB
VLSKSAPKYPAEARKDKAEGVVVLELLVDEAGKITDIKVLQDPDERLTRAAIDAVRQWTFQPARTSAGKAVAVRTALTIKFDLK